MHVCVYLASGKNLLVFAGTPHVYATTTTTNCYCLTRHIHMYKYGRLHTACFLFASYLANNYPTYRDIQIDIAAATVAIVEVLLCHTNRKGAPKRRCAAAFTVAGLRQTEVTYY